METKRTPVEVFYSFAEADAPLLEQLERHLSALQREGLISSWHKRQIEAGSVRQMELDHHLNTASLILLLVSSDFLASDYCYGTEMRRALQRYAAKEALVIPILLRSCVWQSAPFAALQALPTGAKPITMWYDRDAAWTNVVVSIRRLLDGKLSADMNNGRLIQNVPIRGLQRTSKHRWTVFSIVTSVIILVGFLLFLLFHNIQLGAPIVTPTQTVSAPASDPYLHKGTLVLNDPLTSNKNEWNTPDTVINGMQITSCDFKEQSYQIILQAQPLFQTAYCWNKVLFLQDFVYQINIKLITDIGGGIIFRLDSNTGHFFYFGINQYGQYSLSEAIGKNFKSWIKDADNNAINRGLGQTNILAIAAEGNQINMYINRKLITTVNIDNYNKGYIGVAIGNDTKTQTSGQANFTDAKVWSLDQ